MNPPAKVESTLFLQQLNLVYYNFYLDKLFENDDLLVLYEDENKLINEPGLPTCVTQEPDTVREGFFEKQNRPILEPGNSRKKARQSCLRCVEQHLSSIRFPQSTSLAKSPLLFHKNAQTRVNEARTKIPHFALSPNQATKQNLSPTGSLCPDSFNFNPKKTSLCYPVSKNLKLRSLTTPMPGNIFKQMLVFEKFYSKSRWNKGLKENCESRFK